MTMTALSAETARALTDEVKADAQAMWLKLLELYDGGAHTTLGYDSWSEYAHFEFGYAKAYAYRLLEAGRVVADLPESPNGDSEPALPIPQSEAVARELTPLRPDPEEMREAWATVVERCGSQPTAQQVRAEVKARLVPSPPPADVASVEPPPHPGDDIRFSRIENAADSLRTLPVADKIVWPVEPGDVAAMDEALKWMDGWLPPAKASWRRHKAALRGAAGLRVVGGS